MPDDRYDPIDLKALRCFAAMARHGSLTRAAIELGITDAAVSQRIKALEKRLKAKLYESRGGKVTLTDAGRRARDMAGRLFDELKEFEQLVFEGEPVGVVTLGAEDPLLRYLLPEIADEFARACPHARLRMLGRRHWETIELVRRNELDVGFVHGGQPLEELRFHAWRTYPAKVLIRRGHPLARRKVPQLADLLQEDVLARYPQVIAESDRRQPHRVKSTLDRLGLPFNVGLEVGNVDTVKHYVLRNDGIAVVPGFCVDQSDDSVFHVIEVPDEFDGDTAYGWVVRPDKHLTVPLRALLEVLESTAIAG